MTGRIIAIGDIHGCHQEFADLLALVAPAKDDQLILLGDLVNRGPDTCRVIDLAREHHARSLLGNHELRLLNYHKTKDPAHLRETDTDTLAKLRPADWDYLAQMTLTHHVEELNLVFVHGGFLPGTPWQKQPAEIVTRIQSLGENGRLRKRAEHPELPFWADLWNGPPFVIYGHTPRREIYKLKWSLGIDTACVMGGALTACVLPERRIVQVKARKKYFP